MWWIGAGVWCRAVQARIHILASGEYEPIYSIQQLLGCRRRKRGHNDGNETHALQRVGVDLVETHAGCTANEFGCCAHGNNSGTVWHGCVWGAERLRV